MKDILNTIRNKQDDLFKVFIFVVAAFVIVWFLPKEGKFKYEFQKNKPWVHEDLFAPFDFAIYKASGEIDAEKKYLRDNHLKYFNKQKQVELNSIKKFNTWLDENFADSLRLRLPKQEYLNLAEKLLGNVYETGVVELNDEVDEQSSVIVLGEENIGEDIELKDLYTPKQAYEYLRNQIIAELESDSFLLLGIEQVISSNVAYNKDLTNKDLATELASVSLTKGGVLKDEKIISTGEIVSDTKFKVLQSLKTDYEKKVGESNNFIWVLTGQALLVLILLFSLFIFIKNVNTEWFRDNMNIGFLLLIIVLFVGVTQMVIAFDKISVYAIPYCIVALLVRTFFGNRLALFTYLITIFLVSFLVPNSFEFVLLESITGILVLYIVLNVNKRSELFITSLLVFVVISLLYISLSLVQEGNFENIVWEKLTWFGTGAGLTLLTYPLIYLFEKLFGFISDVTLLELSDTNNGLLRELNLKAPGTFQHSLQVSNLAEEAIREIGGNPLLVRTGALYHDIGKMLAPAYFIENQSGVNPHDELGYEESADIIISHVINGIELAKKHNLPEQIIDFIRTHHGTTKTQYFLRMFRDENADEVDESIFQYPGPTPYSKETAVLMMADSVEAASRSLKTYNQESISGLVGGIIDNQVKEQQFINTNITFRDINDIKKLFVKKLMNIYHVRIEYPK